MRVLVAYNCWRKGVDVYYERVWALLRSHGHDVKGYCSTIKAPAPRMSFNALNRAWRSGDPVLLRHLAELEKLLEHRDVLVNWHGSNLPAQFVQQLPIHTVFVCNDDPESSYDLSRPVAWAYDQAFAGNIAELDAYRDWGCTHVEFLPMGFAPWDVNPGLTEETLNLGNRDIDVVFFGERESPWRRPRLDRLARAFPTGTFSGRGWARGFVPKAEMLAIYARSKIGVNIHNSTGPINQRLYQLPANGVTQICDNKRHLDGVFEMGREVVGFETIGECIDLVHHYLAHEDERVAIALAGYRRAHRDYGILAVWGRLEASIQRHLEDHVEPHRSASGIAEAHRRATRSRRMQIFLRTMALTPARKAKQAVKSVLKVGAGSQESVVPPHAEQRHREVIAKYYRPPIGRVMSTSVRLGILTDFRGEYERYRRACEEIDVPYQLVDFISDRWLVEVKRAACDGYIVHPTHWISVWKEMFDERLRVMTCDLGLKIWPRLEEVWIYEAKRRLCYWLQVHHIPHPETHVFYDRDEARDYLLRASYPLVYKTHVGSAASGVRILADCESAVRLLDRAFAEGVLRTPGDPRDRSWGYVLLQHFIPDVREFRVIKIGGSWFGHEKVRDSRTGFHSGSNIARWITPPAELLDFCYRVAQVGHFSTMCFDVFLTKHGRWLIDELHTVFGSYDPAQMYVEGKPGRFVRRNGEWIFEEGLFNRNGGANLRVRAFLDWLESEEKVKRSKLKYRNRKDTPNENRDSKRNQTWRKSCCHNPSQSERDY